MAQDIPNYTPLDGRQAALGAIGTRLKGEPIVQSLQEYHAALP